MGFYIGIEDLAANALIEKLEKGTGRSVSYRDIEEYGARVVRFLSAQGEKAVLILSRDNTNALFRDYSDFFEEMEDGTGIILKTGKEKEDLICQFRGYLALDVLLALVNETCVQALGV